MIRLFTYISRKICFTFAIALYSVSGASGAVLVGMAFIWAAVGFKLTDTFYMLLMIIVPIICLSALTHYFLFGLGRIFNIAIELKSLRIINDNVVGYEIPSNTSAEILEQLSLKLRRLPFLNLTTASVLSLPPIILAPLVGFILTINYLTALSIFISGLLAGALYLGFTVVITGYLTSVLHRESTRKFVSTKKTQ
ncbi:MAG: hypothetical protein JRG81_04445 [Deltaproteobacteria bacterium]|nr:hypothetical protein [Deltaproteobacteria bacterium]MBW2179608.1 hypothetical protein [Deltaproteobacteria bacterium]